MSGVVETISNVLFGKEPKPPALPEAKIPAVPAPNRREDTGAKIVVGSDAKDQRVSGRKSGSGGGSSGGDVLGGLGRGGLSI